MLTEIYIEALLIDEELADQVWEAWDVLPTSYERVRLLSGKVYLFDYAYLRSSALSICENGESRAKILRVNNTVTIIS